MYPCLNCKQCKYVMKGTTFKHPGTGEIIEIYGYHTCLTQFVVYAIEKGHTAEQLRFTVLEMVPPLERGGDRELRLREVWWINKLNSLHPHGLNKDYNLYLFL
ncbi:hypothetical protein XELAEV_18013164mg [Xenopus laevis]|uniref:Uncharacterized protein n=1 Tax=Xenopus laevis TaxID=8355 RepID=A0A974HYW7_XENLA|nr:hypothetical protein XELAEV_18013164mg [Xenopus laevis]